MPFGNGASKPESGAALSPFRGEKNDNRKLVFQEQCAHGFHAWAEPFVTLRVPKLFNQLNFTGSGSLRPCGWLIPRCAIRGLGGNGTKIR